MSEDYNFLRSFTFNEKETKHLFQISQVRLPFLSKDNDYLKIGNADGRYFKGSKLGDLTISIDGFIIKDNSKMSVSDTIDELVKIVNSDEPKRLVLDALDDRYFLATFNGTQEYDATNLKYTPLTLNFDVPEAFARAISINGYSNIKYNVEGNLMLDSEFENTPKFWKPFAYKISEKYNESNILQADFRTGYPVGATEHLTYLQVTPNSRRRIQDITVGDKVSVSTYYRFKQLGVDLEEKEDDYIVATIHLDEWGGTPLRIQHTHSVDVKKSDVILNTFKQIGGIFSITSDKTTHINLTVGFAGLSLFEMSKPMFVYKTDKQDISDIEYKKSNNTLVDVINVTNTGTYKTPILSEFTITGESGLVGLINVNNQGVLQFGDNQDVDGKSKFKTENVLNLKFTGSGNTGFDYTNTNFVSVYPKMNSNNNNNLFSGSFDMLSEYNSIKPKYSNENQPSNSWNGPSGVSNITSPSSNNRGQSFGFFTRVHFNDFNNVKQRGRLECSIMDTTDKPYINLLLRDSVMNSSNIIIEGYYKGSLVWKKELVKNTINVPRFELSVVRTDAYIRFNVAEIKSLGPSNVGTSGVKDSYTVHKYTYSLVEPDETPVSKVGVWLMRYSNSSHIERMLIDDIQFRWYNTPVWSNVTNTFQDGDIVSINVDERKLYINGIENTELNVVGNEWDKFYIGLEDTKFQPIVSSWSNKPLVNINVQNRYI
ncbi:MAG: phage tail family protein [Erysipelotrichaceae bacterium]